MIGIIGGSGLYKIEGIAFKEEKEISTPYGKPSASYRVGEAGGVGIAFLPRHGSPHNIAPHKINYRANIWGFREIGVKRIISVSAVGGINPQMKPGDIAVLDQIIDMTENRASTFYDDEEVVHIDFTEPYCPELRKTILASGEKTGIGLKDKAAYLCVNGPRLETAAEIKAFSLLGADVVGMTGMPEASLARELELCFSGIAVVTNYAAGISGKKLTTTEVVETMTETIEKIKLLLKETIGLLPVNRNCNCKDALKDAKM